MSTADVSVRARLLVLDDEPGVARLQQMSLEEGGFVVDTVHTPEDAERYLRTNACDLVVLDYRLNHALTGLDFYQKLKADGVDIPAVLVTGFSDETRVIAAIRAGIRDVVPKSGEYLDYLPQAVQRVLDQISAERHMREAEQLKHANRLKDEFLATLAHELRNPLAPIRFAVALLSDVSAPDHVRARNTIDRQLTHMVRLVDDLLDVSRITRDKINLRKEPMKLDSVLRSAVETVAPLVEGAHQRLMVVQPVPDVWLDADAARLTQVFSNLLNNASKYSPHNTVITLWAESDGSRVRIGVRDSGKGIAPEEMPRLFDMFFQGSENRYQSPAGLGIGLTLVRRLVQMHEGTVEANSDGVGKGAEFVVTLPVAAASSTRTESEGKDAGRQPQQKTRVLVVDDNVDAADLLTLVIERVGHEARTAHDGPSAVAAFSEFRPRVALLDIGLPGTDGYQLARDFRARIGDEVFLVAITGWGQDDDRRRAREAGFNCHLLKPADPLVIEKMLSAATRGERCTACANCLSGSDRQG